MVGIAVSRPPWLIVILFAMLTITTATATVCGKGIPALRHDWTLPLSSADWRAYGASYIIGWLPYGFEAPQLHPTGYLVGLWFLLTGLLGDPAFWFVVTVAGSILALWAGAFVLSSRMGGGPIPSACCASIAALSPWTFNEFVAGHLVMVAACGGSALMLGELLNPAPRPARVLVAAALLVAQVQFFAVFIVILIVMWRRVGLSLLIFCLALGLPAYIAIAADYGAFLAVPVALPWFEAQSVPIEQGAILSGYFARYADQLVAWELPVLIAFAVLAAGGAAFVLYRRRGRWIVVLALLTLIFVAGVRAPLLGSAIAFIFERIHVLDAFRELYDLVGLIAVAYAACAAVAIRRFPFIVIPSMAAVAFMAACWFTGPPSLQFVAARTLPHASLPPGADRVVLLPAFQPYSFHGRGSGTDPDLASYQMATRAINFYVPTYPVDAALAAAEQGVFARLPGLGVATIIDRPWLEADHVSQAAQLSVGVKSRKEQPSPEPTSPIVPLVSEVQRPQIGSITDRPGDGNVHYADATSRSFFDPVAPPIRSLSADRDWVDVRTAYRGDPQLAEPFGGAFTTSASATLFVARAPKLLVSVQGELVRGDGSVVTVTTAGYHWVTYGESAMLQCRGRCAVAARGDPPAVPADPAPRKFRALAYRRWAPFLLTVRHPDGDYPIVRLNVAFDRGWIALDGIAPLKHVRLDAAANGWFGAGARNETIVLLQFTALLELIAEVAIVLAVATFLVLTTFRRISALRR
jgi:hypothetical protein